MDILKVLYKTYPGCLHLRPPYRLGVGGRETTWGRTATEADSCSSALWDEAGGHRGRWQAYKLVLQSVTPLAGWADNAHRD